MSNFLGLQCKLYYNSGVYGTPVWNELTNVKDNKLGGTKATADATTRAAAGYKVELPTLKELSLAYKMLYDPTDAGFIYIQGLFLANTAAAGQAEFAIMDGDITVSGTKGFRASFAVKKFDRDESLTEAVTYDVEMSAAPSAHAPALYTTP